MLNYLAEADAEDLPTLLAAFDVGRYLELQLQLPTEHSSRLEVEALRGTEELTVLALTVERLLCAAPLRTLGTTTFISRIASVAFPTNLPLALEIVLTAAAGAAGLPTGWDAFFEALPFDVLNVRDAARLLHAINGTMPLPPSHLHAAVAFTCRALLSSPHMAGL